MHDLRRAYRLLFAPEGTLKERVEDVATEFEAHPLVHEILDFIVRAVIARFARRAKFVRPSRAVEARTIVEGGLKPGMPLRIAIVAGEASGDELGASLLRALAARGVVCEARGLAVRF